MKQKFILFISIIASGFGALAQKQASPRLTRYVDQYIGTGFHGHVFVGANVPFGAVQLGPTNISKGWDWCSGYHISDSTIIGFQHTHLSGTGIGDLGDISFMPTTGSVIVNKGTLANPSSGYFSLFSHKDEIVKPGYYAVKLKKYNIRAELTASTRVGYHRYTYPAGEQANIIIDLTEGVADRTTDAYIKQKDKYTIEGYRFSRGWAADQRIYFTAVFSKPIEKFAVYDSTALKQGVEINSKNARCALTFAKSNVPEKVEIKVGISPVSCANALQNIKAEIPGWNFNLTATNADLAWNKELGRITIKADSLSQLKKFYTALYHTMIAPSTFNDVNGEYWGTDKKVHKDGSFKNLTTFSLWDTYRSANPLYTIMQPDRVPDMINTMLNIYKQQGRLPVWHLMANETNTMVGNSAVPIIVDAYLKGFKGFDANLAYEAVKKTQMQDLRGLKYVKELGFIPADSSRESVAMGLEYSINDWCIAQMAKKLGKMNDYQYFSGRAKNYQKYFDPQSRFMRGKVSADTWRTPFSPFESRHEKDDYTEGNAWQYTWLVPQDVEGLITLLGGEKPFIKKLDSLFVVNGDLGAEHSPDISGLIGQYAHGNEPSHHITYLYAYVGQPWKTADKVRYILNNFYTTKADGIIGNEDVGQMSAWYVLSSLGFYPVNPANGNYVFGSPNINSAVIQLPSGKSFTITVKNNSANNRYISSMVLDGKPYSKNYLKHTDLVAGGTLVITMTDKPGKFGTAPTDRPRSVTF
ncbi:GH92 family glycosyl hydrolase [Mucilaginibacter sp.]|uniref:GH92 family glycosyl hydrolase n=1 Tax=Mucilaginibacter sp. TaxID=1882438 RepID=UPI000CA6D13D|nr:GH92 family glycosyl hydrolase [Mucilaginibacter sp.]PLW89731.1 MAG: sugar hydrolase [Mucilaginibacter sp.]PMP66006.1 MAG: sugar hydrolase [Mucilaginibacter sp.]HEK22339.1 glycoside hydrolase family 92 protein [Bacteroidota bacterium]